MVGSPASRLATLPEGLPEYTLGWEVAKAAVKYLRQPNGETAGQRWQWVDSQLRFLLWWYAVDGEGRWLYRHGARRLAKGSGKSPFAAVLSLAELCFPVRLHDFDSRVPGGCVGKPKDAPWVQICATAESQTVNTMRMVRAIAHKGSRVVRDFGLDPGKQRYYRLGSGEAEGRLETITSSFTAVEGAQPSHVTADETEHWTPSNGGPTLFATLADNLTKSGDARILETANAWEPGTECVAEQTWEAWLAQEEGRTRGATSILYDARMAPFDTDLADEDSLMRGLEFVYDDCWWVDRRAIMERVWAPNSRPDDSMRKYLNWPTAASDSWVSAQDWAARADASKSLSDGDELALFFDGSKSRDATALVGARLSDGHVVTFGVWEPQGDGVVDTREVDAAVRRVFERYTVRGFFADVREWEQFVDQAWPDDLSESLVVWALPSGKRPQPIAWDMRSHTREFAEACEHTAAEIGAGGFTHDGDARVARHVANAKRYPVKGRVAIGKESKDSPRKMDAAVCVVGARMVRRLVLASPEYAKRNRKREAVFF